MDRVDDLDTQNLLGIPNDDRSASRFRPFSVFLSATCEISEKKKVFRKISKFFKLKINFLNIHTVFTLFIIN